MKGTKIFGMVVAVVCLVFVIGPVASAQGVDPGILHGKLLKIKASLKGYEVNGNSIVGPISGGTTTYLKMIYNLGSPGTYTVETCTQDDDNPDTWHSVVNDPISLGNIYGANLEVWDFDGHPISFDNGFGTFHVYLLLSTKITTDGPNFKKASFKAISCSVWGELSNGHDALGSCKLSGSSLAADKVPFPCQ